MGRQLLILLPASSLGVFAALALGAVNLGTALGVGQLTFAATLVCVLLRDRASEAASALGEQQLGDAGDRAGVVTFRFGALAEWMQEHGPPRRLDQHRLVGCGVADARRPQAPRAAPRVRKTCGVCAAPQLARSTVPRMTRVRFPSLSRPKLAPAPA